MVTEVRGSGSTRVPTESRHTETPRIRTKNRGVVTDVRGGGSAMVPTATKATSTVFVKTANKATSTEDGPGAEEKAPHKEEEVRERAQINVNYGSWEDGNVMSVSISISNPQR